ncbi:hypothetical protein BDR04DRAFT_1003374, partial [Suillus decipiens]
SKAGETGNFKPAVYTAAAENIAGLWTNGAKKTGAHCKTKWTLKQIYSMIETYCNRSGFHWDDDHGAGIEGDAAIKVWNEYTQKKVCTASA